MTNCSSVLLQYMGSFPVAGPDQASRAEYMRTQIQQMRVSATWIFILINAHSITEFNSTRDAEECATPMIKFSLLPPLISFHCLISWPSFYSYILHSFLLVLPFSITE